MKVERLGMKTVEQQGSVYLQREWNEWRIEKWLNFPAKLANLLFKDRIKGNLITRVPKAFIIAFRSCRWEMIYSHVPMNSDEISAYRQHQREYSRHLKTKHNK